MEKACHKCRHDERYCFWPSGSPKCGRCTDLKRRCSPSLRRPKLSERRLALHNRTHTGGTNLLMDRNSQYELSSTSASAATDIRGRYNAADAALGSLPLSPGVSQPKINRLPPRHTPFDKECACCVGPGRPPPSLSRLKETRDKINKLYDDGLEERPAPEWICGDFNKYMLPLEDLCKEAALVSIHDSELYLAMCCTLHAAFDLCKRLANQIRRELDPCLCSAIATTCWLVLQRITMVSETLGLWSLKIRLSLYDDENPEECFLSRQYGLPCEQEANHVQACVELVRLQHFKHYM
ncbi:hypothetical protein DM02DRAFT_96947 [Periconia macrospinosa]|uniref:Zn(2)-C6 fungal-type domain-containing protein n=1 Tax=Periconia macrospinosa TaxID=97972 RepID=A0A2V1E4E4_9PLEO|nr:hypothetical protein DM02DRAFT_96947 [Periconia macrospinosa]